MKMTAKQFAERHNVKYGVATSTLVFLTAKGAVTRTEERISTVSGKGRGQTVFEVNDKVTLKLT